MKRIFNAAAALLLVATPVVAQVYNPTQTLINTNISTWTPSDQSGAGLTFTVKDTNWVRNGKLCTVSGNITFPATASGATAVIGSLPCTAHNGTGTTVSGGTVSSNVPGLFTGMVLNNSTNLEIWADASATFKTNADLQLATLIFTITYITN